jgi:hypothetical protein
MQSPCGYSHDAIERMMENQRLPSHVIWEYTKTQIISSQNGYLAFDDTILDKQGSSEIELVHKHYSGNAHEVIRGICMVNCAYVNPETNQFGWLTIWYILQIKTENQSFGHISIAFILIFLYYTITRTGFICGS